MASSLNKRRILYTKLGLVLLMLASIFSQPTFNDDGFVHGFLDMAGNALVMACALGRLYCTAFLGGHKNTTLVVYGPFSMTRNPLYFLSFVGVCGVVLISNHVTLILLIPASFLAIYMALIKREELFLLSHFGQSYRDYCAKTPRFFPKISRYQSPDTVPMCPRFMLYALRDSILWLSILPLFELIEGLQEAAIIPQLFWLP